MALARRAMTQAIPQLPSTCLPVVFAAVVLIQFVAQGPFLDPAAFQIAKRQGPVPHVPGKG